MFLRTIFGPTILQQYETCQKVDRTHGTHTPRVKSVHVAGYTRCPLIEAHSSLLLPHVMKYFESYAHVRINAKEWTQLSF